MSTPGETAAMRTSSPQGLAASLARAVSDDLEIIFPNASPRPGGLRLRLARRSDPPRPATGRGEGRAVVVGALVAAAFVGVSAGALFSHGPGPARPVQAAASSPSLESIAVDPSRTAPVSDPTLVRAPVAVAPTPVAISAPIRTVKAHKASVHKVAASRAAERRASVRKVSGHETAARQASVHKVSTRKAAVRAPARTRTARAAACRSTACAPSIYTADARLRESYTAAIAAKVPRGVLVDYRDEWEGLRHRAPDQSGLVAARYNDMAGELDRIAARRLAEGAAPRRSGSHHRLRTQLAELWR